MLKGDRSPVGQGQEFWRRTADGKNVYNCKFHVMCILTTILKCSKSIRNMLTLITYMFLVRVGTKEHGQKAGGTPGSEGPGRA